jgi:hypothetical protein
MGPTTTDWIAAVASVALVVVALVGFIATVLTIISARNRQRLEIEGYIRVDVGPPEGTDDYSPPPDIVHVESRYLKVLGSDSKESVTVSAWYRNMQQHPLGVALGVTGRVLLTIHAEDEDQLIDQVHEIAYLEPGRTVRVDIARFPKTCSADLFVQGVRYKNLDWDAAIPRHGRRECHFRDGRFEMVPWAEPMNSLRDWIARRSASLLRRRN